MFVMYMSEKFARWAQLWAHWKAEGWGCSNIVGACKPEGRQSSHSLGPLPTVLPLSQPCSSVAVRSSPGQVHTIQSMCSPAASSLERAGGEQGGGPVQNQDTTVHGVLSAVLNCHVSVVNDWTESRLHSVHGTPGHATTTAIASRCGALATSNKHKAVL